jgi:hypothetical protein
MHPGTVNKPYVFAGANGDAAAVWVQVFVSERKVWVNRFNPGAGWVDALELGTTDGSSSDPSDTAQPQVTVDSDGNAMAAWADFVDPIVRGIVARRYTKADGWRPEEVVYDGGSTAGDPRMDVDLSGDVTATWETGTGIWTNRYSETDKWGVAVTIDEGPNVPRNPQIAAGPGGSAWVVWEQQPAGTVFNIYGNAFTEGIGWGTALPIATDTNTSAINPQLAVDANGNAVFAWIRIPGLEAQVWSNHWIEMEAEITNPERLDGDSGAASAVQIAGDPKGNATAVWRRQSGLEVEILASRYSPSGHWEPAEAIANGAITSDPRVAMDANGNAMVIYARDPQNGNQIDVWANIYTAGRWGNDVQISPTERTGDAFQPDLAMDPDGNAVAVWRQGPDVWSARYE